MLDGEEALRYCLKNGVTIEQFFIMYLLARNDFHLSDKRSLGKAYVHKIGMFREESFSELIKAGLIENFNAPGDFYPELFMLTPTAREQFLDYEIASELWDKYPVRFPLGEKGFFVARSGGDKDELLELYTKKINHSTPRHKFVLEQLGRYEKMVLRGEINGHKLGDWIRMEMWDTIAAIKEEGGEFGKDL